MTQLWHYKNSPNCFEQINISWEMKIIEGELKNYWEERRKMGCIQKIKGYGGKMLSMK